MLAQDALTQWKPVQAKLVSGLLGWSNVLLTHVPLVLMAVLAFVSFAVLKQAPNLPSTSSAAAFSQHDDYYLKQFVTTSYNEQGAAKVILQGSAAQHNPIAKALRIEQVRFKATSPATGAHYQGSSLHGVVADGGKTFSLSQQVVIDKAAMTGKSATHFEGEQIQFTTDPDTVTSTLPVRIQSGKDITTAQTLHYENATQITNMTGRVRMVIEGK